jgi:hypothetical protein
MKRSWVDHTGRSLTLADIAARWENIGSWSAPLRNPLWIETEEGTPVAAVSGSFSELTSGEVERRRQAIAHAPSDVQALLAIIRGMGARPQSRRRASRARAVQPAMEAPMQLSAA